MHPEQLVGPEAHEADSPKRGHRNKPLGTLWRSRIKPCLKMPSTCTFWNSKTGNFLECAVFSALPRRGPM